jgi:hypothetical protein
METWSQLGIQRQLPNIFKKKNVQFTTNTGLVIMEKQKEDGNMVAWELLEAPKSFDLEAVQQTMQSWYQKQCYIQLHLESESESESECSCGCMQLEPMDSDSDSDSQCSCGYMQLEPMDSEIMWINAED